MSALAFEFLVEQMKQRIITNAKIKELLKFLPLFDDSNRDFIKEWEDPIKKNGTFTFINSVYCYDVKEFFKLAAQECLIMYLNIQKIW
jgi:hypothetical protein